ncbi:MAG: hypothetical protein ABI548_21230 [Polyangiaceae bacterium]
MNCSGSCVNLQTDAKNCLTCGHLCASGQICSGGSCVQDCGNNTRCGNTCANLSTDPNNCQACGTHCSAPAANGIAVCSGAAGCGIQCNSGITTCGKACCDAAPANSHAHSSCVSNACGVQCDANYHACNSTATPCYSDGDPQHCGTGCLDCSQANANSACKGGTQTTCANTCNGPTISACPAVNGKPFCGSWDFESATPAAEGWSISAPDTTASVSLKISTARHYNTGKSSLAISFSNSSGEYQQVVVRTSLCAGPKVSYTLNSTLTFEVYFETAQGSTPLVSPGYTGYIEAWNQSVPTSGGNDFYANDGEWTYANVGGAFDFTDWGFVLGTRSSWKGTIYIDNIVFTP